MLQIQHICKEYTTGKFVQKALDDFSLNLRDNEFVAILGPSGSGKTTLLNIIGGLDRYDSGELIINGISTRKYKDRDWDSYRNHTIGFVFQSYNLIPHQTLLSNVELALTISGVSRRERRQRAMDALDKVGLKDHAYKLPNQISGGQMQRVAIARALVNDPDIVLADEPTGALDSVTSVQVMELLKEVAKDRLVVMVTHNPELARQYATRIVEIRDGKMTSDTDPYVIEEPKRGRISYRNMGKSSMSLMTSISLSFNNLLTKKARTILTAFAGSIGIIGIALIMSISSGVNNYIADIEEETLTGYPLQITSSGFDMSAMMERYSDMSDDDGEDEEERDDEIATVSIITSVLSSVAANDLGALKEYIDSGESGMEPYISAVEYSYDIDPQIYLEYEDGSYRQVHPDSSFSILGFGSGASSSSMISSMMSTDVFHELPAEESLYIDEYDINVGRWPENYNEVVLVLSKNGTISDFMLYSLGLRNGSELDEMVREFADSEDIDTPDDVGNYLYDEVLGLKFRLVPASDYYEYDEQYKIWKDKTDNEEYMRELVANAEELTIVGVVQPKPGAFVSMLSSGLYYPSSLIEHIAEIAVESEIVQDQLANPDINIFTGEAFGTESSAGAFDLNYMFEIDEEALANAISFDSGALADALVGDLDITGMINFDPGELDISSLDLELPELDTAAVDWSGLLDGITFEVDVPDMSEMATELVEDYMSYIAEAARNGTEDTAEGTADENGMYMDGSVSGESEVYDTEDGSEESETSGTVREITEQGPGTWTDANSIDSLTEQLASVFMGYIGPGGIDIQGLAGSTEAERLIDSFMTENGIESFSEYLGTEQAREIISSMLVGAVDTESVRDQIIERLSPYTDEMVSSYVQALQDMASDMFSDTISSMITSVYSGITDQITAALSETASSLTSQITSQISSIMTQAMTGMMRQMTESFIESVGEASGEDMEDLFASVGSAMDIDENAFMEAFSFAMDSDELVELIVSMNSGASATYSGNLSSLGYVDFGSPYEISIYPVDFAGKDKVTAILDEYNERMEDEGHDEKVITYTDLVGTLMSSVTDIIDMISYVLIAFVSVSLIVSSIMIGVITYISVLERRKEIGILRSIGASKENISEIFIAETGIIGFCAGVIGIAVSLFLQIPGDALIHYLAGNDRVNLYLAPIYCVTLVVLSVALTLIGGLIPARKASNSDPVTALRTD